MPQKIRDLLKVLPDAASQKFQGQVKGLTGSLVHPKYRGAVTVSGKPGDDAKRYREKQIAQAVDAGQK